MVLATDDTDNVDGFHLPLGNDCAVRNKKSYKAWLHHEGTGLFVMMPPTGG